MAVEVTTPEENMGDVIGDLNSRRGTIQAMEERGGSAPRPGSCAAVGDVRLCRGSAIKTQGRASYSMQFDSYAEVPRTLRRRSSQRQQGSEQ